MQKTSLPDRCRRHLLRFANATNLSIGSTLTTLVGALMMTGHLGGFHTLYLLALAAWFPLFFWLRDVFWVDPPVPLD